MQKIVPSLWFDKNCEEAINFYIDTFNSAPHTTNNSKIVHIERYPEGKQIGPTEGMEGKIITAIFELAGQKFMALDGGPLFKFNESISFYVECADQEEVDYFWNKMTADGGEESQCGWLKDKFGVSWQIVPKQLGELLSDSDKEKAGRVMDAMLKMQKIIVADLEKAYER
jgi:predicted 3-demethylubiquinone-9 3-methyltransferase (glyoxalase superfamily)